MDTTSSSDRLIRRHVLVNWLHNHGLLLLLVNRLLHQHDWLLEDLVGSATALRPRPIIAINSHFNFVGLLFSEEL